jgi:hypothetical protein
MIERRQLHHAGAQAAYIGAALLLVAACARHEPTRSKGSAGLLSSPPETRTLPAGTRVVVRFAQTLSSHQSQPGELFRARVEQDVVAGGTLVVPEGSMVVGSVVEANPGRQPGQEARLGLDFHLLELPSGESVPLSAAISGPVPSDPPGEPASGQTDDPAMAGEEGRPIRIPADAIVTLELAEPATIALQGGRLVGRAARGQR